MKEIKAIDFRFFIGCPCYLLYPNKKVLTTIVGFDAGLNTVETQIALGVLPSLIKPILRRFENLSRHELEQLNKLWPKENIKRTTFDSIKLDADIINFLTLLNVDVFGWIDQGFAIDAGL